MEGVVWPSFIRHQNRWHPVYVGPKQGAFIILGKAEKEYVRSFSTANRADNRGRGLNVWPPDDEEEERNSTSNFVSRLRVDPQSPPHEYQCEPWGQTALPTEEARKQVYDGHLTIGQVPRMPKILAGTYENKKNKCTSVANRLCLTKLPLPGDCDAWVYIAEEKRVYGVASSVSRKLILFTEPVEHGMSAAQVAAFQAHTLPFLRITSDSSTLKAWIQKAKTAAFDPYRIDRDPQPIAYHACLLFVLSDAKWAQKAIHAVERCYHRLLRSPSAYDPVKEEWTWKFGARVSVTLAACDCTRAPPLLLLRQEEPVALQMRGTWYRVPSSKREQELVLSKRACFYILGHNERTSSSSSSWKAWDADVLEKWLAKCKPVVLSPPGPCGNHLDGWMVAPQQPQQASSSSSSSRSIQARPAQ